MKKSFNDPKSGATRSEDAAMPYNPNVVSSPSEQVRQKRQASLMAIDGVEGVGTGQDAVGNEAVVVYVRDQEAARRVPRKVDGLNVVVQVTGQIEALKL